MEPRGRVLGAVRTLSEAVSARGKCENSRRLVIQVLSGSYESFSLHQLEQALCYFTNHNSNYTNVCEDEFHVLAEETLNNSIRSILVYDDFSGFFGDAEVYSLSMAFQYNLSVEALTLRGINISDEAICSLCEALVRSRVNYIDLSNTPLEDEAGRSIAALGHINPYLRTVIVDDTLIADDVLDEIDVACQFNQSNFEGNRGEVDESMLRPADLGRLKHRLQQIVRAQEKKVHYCVAHLFGCCPNGDMCLYSHSLGKSGMDETDTSLSAKISELFVNGGNWEERLPPRPTDGPSWRNPEDEVKRTPRIHNARRRREQDSNTTTTAPAPAASKPAQQTRWSPFLSGVAGMCCGFLAVGLVGVVARRLAPRSSPG
ncbi:conserved hypothetical protein [Leishmania mexicana MHOM/GT/2001/U1103]|uniref:C3H1-type domain-containing protein n=1 Tax=Leishmania mexicana (strain MHOM/GT/2001/U1103) TaxID=929439 RepID=E9AYS2_LEIMU|nr:conserved hypothetical protein [Leishmania mexicana MHOM/GT/2001/U1103]CBZ28115.1 conserved hypothetical protein [Leishmania mexicana MHOM/GT/2001/U1103]